MASGELSPPGRPDLVIAANRLPVRQVAGGWRRSPGGLVTTLEPVVRAHGAHWLGWSGGQQTAPGRFEHDGMVLHPVPLPEADFAGYYEGYANSTIWPLYHDAVIPPVFNEAWWGAYARVNRCFAEAAAAVVAPGGVVWVQDYHLQLVPAMLRGLRPDVGIGFFLHIPVPAPEVFRRLPERAKVLDGLLGADLLGFQRPTGARYLRQLARVVLGRRSRGRSVRVGERWVRTGGFPASIDFAGIESAVASPAIVARSKQIRADLGEPRKIIFGVERLDYTKGIEQRLAALRELFDQRRLTASDLCVLQIAVPSREAIASYQGLRSRITDEVDQINRRHPGAVRYVDHAIGRDELLAHYLAADVMAVTPLNDGMNLVAKEYVAARADLAGALVLSEFAGAAAELRQAYLVNPYDRAGVEAALCRAVEAPAAERARRMRAMRAQIRRRDVWDWAQRFLTALTEARAVDPEQGSQVRPA